MKKVFLLLLILPFFFACKDDASSSNEPETKPKPAPVGCSIDTDCGSGKICENGTCIKRAYCGDGYLDEGEQCDGSLFRDKNLPAGVQCTYCQYDTHMVQFQP